MDVRCERCRTQYVFGEDQVGPDGLTVRCSNCGHVFLVKKKALVVTVPVKPGDLRQEPVPTADLDRGVPSQAAAAPSRTGAEKGRPWTLRNHRGDLYPFKELSTLQKWIVERKAGRDDEVSHQGGPWRRLGDMLELEPFFALVDRAGRAATPVAMRAGGNAPASSAGPRGGAAQPTLIDFPAPRPASPDPGHQPAPARTERFPAPPEAAKPEPRPELPPSPAESTMSLGSVPIAADEGPVPGEIAPVSGSEPAWTSQPEGVEKPKRPPPAPRQTKRPGFGPILVVLALAAGAAAVYVTNPGLLGLARPGIAPPKPEGSQPAPQGESAAGVPERPAAAPEPTPQATSGAVPGTPPPAEPVPGTPQAKPMTSPPGAISPTTSPSPSTEHGTTNSPATTSSSPAPEEPEKPSADDAKEAPVPSAEKPAREPPKAAAAAPKRPSAVAQAIPQKPSELKRLLVEARRLRGRGKPEAALRAYGRAIEVDLKNADALAGRGLCYLELSQYGPAEASFQAALEADARHAEALMGLAETYRYEGRRTEAVTYYQRYVAAHPDGEDAAAARNAIDALKE